MKKFLFAFAVMFLGVFASAQDDHGDRSDMYRTVDPFGNDVWVVVDPPMPKGAEAFSERYLDEDKFFPVEELNRAATVPVYAIADEEYRSAHSNWQSLLNTIIETADNAYYRDFGINWVIQGYYTWTSNGSNSSAILSDLATDASSLPNGIAMGFTKDTKFTAGGIAYVYNSNPGTAYLVCLDQGTSSTTYALRHEAYHNYGCSHDFDPVVCMMNYTYSYSIDYFDNAHKNTVSSHSGWFQ